MTLEMSQKRSRFCLSSHLLSARQQLLDALRSYGQGRLNPHALSPPARPRSLPVLQDVARSLRHIKFVHSCTEILDEYVSSHPGICVRTRVHKYPGHTVLDIGIGSRCGPSPSSCWGVFGCIADDLMSIVSRRHRVELPVEIDDEMVRFPTIREGSVVFVTTGDLDFVRTSLLSRGHSAR